LALGFLDAQHIRLVFFEPGDDGVQPDADRVDVISGDFHRKPSDFSAVNSNREEKMAENSSSNVASVAIVVIILLAIFAFYFLFGRGVHAKRDIHIAICLFMLFEYSPKEKEFYGESTVRKEISTFAAGRDGRRESATAGSWTNSTQFSGCGRHYRDGHFCAHWDRGPRQDGAGANALVCRCRSCIHLCGTVLCRICLNGAGRRFGIHVCVRSSVRAIRMDRRLGFDPRISRRICNGGARMVALLSARLRTFWLHTPICS